MLVILTFVLPKSSSRPSAAVPMTWVCARPSIPSFKACLPSDIDTSRFQTKLSNNVPGKHSRRRRPGRNTVSSDVTMLHSVNKIRTQDGTCADFFWDIRAAAICQGNLPDCKVSAETTAIPDSVFFRAAPALSRPSSNCVFSFCSSGDKFSLGKQSKAFFHA